MRPPGPAGWAGASIECRVHRKSYLKVKRRPSHTWASARAGVATFSSKITPPAGRALCWPPRGPLREPGANSRLIRPFSTRWWGRSYIRVISGNRAHFRGSAGAEGGRGRTKSGGNSPCVILAAGWWRGHRPGSARRARQRQASADVGVGSLQGRGSYPLTAIVWQCRNGSSRAQRVIRA